MGNIVVLDELTINKIAAGEVIERPASVIKEMAENSIDAGAKNITVEVKNGGISYIRVTDDGKGIEKEDLELSFERHATSKIRKAEDLNTVKSMGFRGEALASIAAISKVEMITKTANDETGSKVYVEGGDVKTIEETGCQTGTTITVQELFYNTPVRYKFLKKDYTETGYIEDVITRLALVHPEISFKLINSGKTIIQTSGDGNLKNVIFSIYGKTVAQACLNIDYDYEGIHITGVVGKPEIARSNRGNQIFFVNKRYIKDRILSNATEKAFKGMIPIGKFGFVILNIELAANSVDVNVHPAKLEVRFQDEQTVFKAVYYAIQDTLLKSELVANSETPLTGKLDKKLDKEQEEQLVEEEEPAPKSAISGLFRKIVKNSNTNDKPEDEEETIIEKIYKNKNEFDLKESKSEEAIESDSEKSEEFDLNKFNTNSSTLNLEDEMSKLDLIRAKYGLKPENPPIFTQEKEPEITEEEKEKNDEAIKNTLNELMQMGKGLTAEQIREKISNLANANKQEKVIKEESRSAEIEGNEAYQENEAEEKNIAPENVVSETEEKYDNGSTQVIDTEKIEELTKNIEQDINNEEEKPKEGSLNEQKPGDILLNILKSKNVTLHDNKNPENPEVDGKFDDMYAQIFGNSTSGVKEKEKQEEEKMVANDIVNSNMNIFEESEEYKNKLPYKFIGIAFRTYIILEIEDELVWLWYYDLPHTG